MLTPNLISRQGEIVEVFLRHGWDSMRRLLVSKASEEPDIPPPAVLRNILTDLGPVYIKFGQLLSTRPDLLPPSYIEALSALQSTVPPVDAVAIRMFLREQLDPDQVFAEVEYSAIASGSIGQVHRAVLKNGQPVALKIQRPGIELQVRRDMALIRDIAKLVSSTQFGQRYNVVALADEFSSALKAELDFTTEAAYTDQLRQNLAKSQWVAANQIAIPEIIWPLTQPKVLVMQWLDGQPILSAALGGYGVTAENRNALSQLLFRSFFQQYFIDGFFHADPHPGNLFYLSDGRLALLDCGMMGRLDPRTRTTLTEMVLAIISADAQRCAQLTLQLAEPLQDVDLAKLEFDYSRLLARYYGLSLQNLNTAAAFAEILEAGTRNHLRWPANIGLFTKSLANLEGVARQFNPQINLID
ncbi:MAG: AarF/UbiB family protein, partial [Cyanobacteria bacterium P01_H01_bin.105]